MSESTEQISSDEAKIGMQLDGSLQNNESDIDSELVERQLTPNRVVRISCLPPNVQNPTDETTIENLRQLGLDHYEFLSDKQIPLYVLNTLHYPDGYPTGAKAYFLKTLVTKLANPEFIPLLGVLENLSDYYVRGFQLSHAGYRDTKGELRSNGEIRSTIDSLRRYGLEYPIPYARRGEIFMSEGDLSLPFSHAFPNPKAIDEYPEESKPSFSGLAIYRGKGIEKAEQRGYKVKITDGESLIGKLDSVVLIPLATG